jgi:general secretion pathway protein D
MRLDSRGTRGVAAIALAAMMVSACATNRAFRRGEEAARAGDWDSAVVHYQRAVQEDPDKPDHKIALERAQRAASLQHFNAAKMLEEKGDLESAIAEYRRAVEYDPSNRQALHRRTELERTVRERTEAARPTPAVEAMRERARRETEPALNPASRQPLDFVFNEASVVDVLQFIADSAGINIVYEPSFKAQAGQKPITLNIKGVSLEEGLSLVMTMSGSWFKVINPRTIFVMPDNAQMRQKYEEQVVRTFYLSHSDAAEINQIVNQVARLPGAGAQAVQAIPNKTANTLTVRASAAMVNIIERIILANDRPRAEILVDVEILEVSRDRAKQLGLNLSNYDIGMIFSPEGRPGGGTGDGGDGDDQNGDGSSGDGTTTGGQVGGNAPFNLNTISRGISMADFYMTVPTAVFRFLASDTRTRLLAKPQLRGAEGEDLSFNIGEEVPVARTTFGGVAAGGVNTVPIQSYEYRPVGIIVKMRSRVTFENEVVLDIELENSTLLGNIIVAGQSLPSFGTRKVKTRMRLREGESNLIAGLVREDERRSLTGFPGLLRVPVLKDLFGSTDDLIESTDVVMLLTPRLVRTHELTQQHLNPIHIGSVSNIGLTGPAPVIAAPPDDLAAPQPVPGPIGPQPPPPGGIPPAPQPALPPGQTSTPGLPPTPAPVTSTPGQQPPPQTPPAGPPTTTKPPTGPPGTTPPPADQTPNAAQSAAQGAGQVTVSTPGPEFRIGSGPYTVPISVAGAARLSVVSLSLTFNPAVLRVRSVQEGSFMRQGGINAPMSQKVDPTGGRVDISITRVGDQTGASGTGLIAAVLFDAIAPGGTTLAISGVATTPDGATASLTFTPATVTVR